MTNLALTNARLADLDAEALGPATTVVVRDGRIDRIGGDVPDGVESVDLGGRTLLPGLIDCHFHVVAHSLDTQGNAVALDSLAALRAGKVMEGLLDAGFTTVRDLGGAQSHPAGAYRRRAAGRSRAVGPPTVRAEGLGRSDVWSRRQ